MFITKDYLKSGDGFDWSRYFGEKEKSDFLDKLNVNYIYTNVRSYLKEDNSMMGFAILKVTNELLKDERIASPSILELGSATGFLTRTLLGIYGGTGVLVDRNEESKKRFMALDEKARANIRYISEDLFKLDIEERFDIVCSFGLIEHFSDKKGVVDAHVNFMKPGGKTLIIVPLDTPLTRAFFEVNPELNLGYRELLTRGEFLSALKASNLKVLKTANSFGYTYDFIAAICELNS